MEVLSEKEVGLLISELRNWKQEGNTITRLFEFADFQNAIAFTVRLGFEAEKLDHHPDIFIHSWNKVKVTLSTHSSGGITHLDIKLAKKIERL